jgi:hypothetical protein
MTRAPLSPSEPRVRESTVSSERPVVLESTGLREGAKTSRERRRDRASR